MTLRILLISLSLLLAWQKVCAQLAPADVFFNSGAQLYISNNIPAALTNVETGLKTYPNDEKLKKLEQLLKQQQQQQQQQSQQNQSQQQKQDQQKNQQQQNQQSSQQNQQKQDEQKQSEQQKQEQQKQQQSDAQKKEGQKQDKQETQGQPAKEGQLTPDEARRLLDAQKDSEQLLQWKPENKPRNPLRPVKDW